MRYASRKAAPMWAKLLHPELMPNSFYGPWGELVAVVGGVSELAEVLGISRRTLHRWAHGITEPNALEKRTINRAAAARGVTPPYRDV